MPLTAGQKYIPGLCTEIFFSFQFNIESKEKKSTPINQSMKTTSVLFLVAVCIVLVTQVHSRISYNITFTKKETFPNSIPALHFANFSFPANLFSASSALIQSSFNADYYYFTQEQFLKLENGSFTVSLANVTNVPANKTAFLSLGTKEKSFQESYNTTLIYFVVKNNDIMPGPVNSVSLSLVFFPPRWLIAIAVLAIIAMVSCFCCVIVVLPAGCCCLCFYYGRKSGTGDERTLLRGHSYSNI
jgi:hypothetical protein